jgi:serine/threonine protein kinase
VDPSEYTAPGYEILAELGRGTTGVVYKARDVRLNRAVALKMPLLGSAADAPLRRARFLREARALGSLATDPDPDFPAIYQVGESQGQLFLAREFVEGGTLEQLAAAGALGLRDGLGILAGVARAVQRVHGRGLAHRRLHPANVLVTPARTARLIGFGLVGPLAGSGMPAQLDVRALQQTLGWLAAALRQALPARVEALGRPGAVVSPGVLAVLLDRFLQEG